MALVEAWFCFALYAAALVKLCRFRLVALQFAFAGRFLRKFKIERCSVVGFAVSGFNFTLFGVLLVALSSCCRVAAQLCVQADRGSGLWFFPTAHAAAA